MVDDLDGVLGRDVHLRHPEADLQQVHAGDRGNDARLLQLADAGAHGGLREADLLSDLDLRNVRVRLEKRKYLSIFFIQIDRVNLPSIE